MDLFGNVISVSVWWEGAKIYHNGGESMLALLLRMILEALVGTVVTAIVHSVLL